MTQSPPSAWTASGVHDAVLDAVKALLASGQSVVDLGAGSGGLSAKLKESGYQVQAAEWLAEAFSVPGVPVHKIDLDNQEHLLHAFPPSSQQAIVCCEVIEHLKYPWRFVETCASMLKPNGLLVLTTPNVAHMPSRVNILINGRADGFGPMRRSMGHVSPLFPTQLVDMIECSGLELLHLQEISPSGAFALREKSLRGLTQMLLTVMLRPLMLRSPRRGRCILAAARKPAESPESTVLPVGSGVEGWYGT